MTAKDRLLTPAEAADRLGVSTAHLRYMSTHGKIRARVTPLGRVFTESEVARVCALRESTPPRGRPSRGRAAAAA